MPQQKKDLSKQLNAIRTNFLKDVEKINKKLSDQIDGNIEDSCHNIQVDFNERIQTVQDTFMESVKLVDKRVRDFIEETKSEKTTSPGAIEALQEVFIAKIENQFYDEMLKTGEAFYTFLTKTVKPHCSPAEFKKFLMEIVEYCEGETWPWENAIEHCFVPDSIVDRMLNFMFEKAGKKIVEGFDVDGEEKKQ